MRRLLRQWVGVSLLAVGTALASLARKVGFFWLAMLPRKRGSVSVEAASWHGLGGSSLHET